MKKEEIIKIIKYVAGSVAAVLLAAALRIEFAYAAGIITLLTIKDTKKETVTIAAKRIVIFIRWVSFAYLITFVVPYLSKVYLL